MDTLIRNVRIITQNEGRENLRSDILIEGNRIAKIGGDLPKKGVEDIVEGEGRIVFPGLVNTHTHVAMGLLRGYGEDLPLGRWLEDKIWPAEKKLTPEDIYWGTLMGAIEMIRGGTTCFNEMYMVGLQRMADAVGKAGMRAVLGQGVFDRMDGRSVEGEMEILEKSVRELHKGSPLVQVAAAPHSLYTCSGELLKKAKEFADKEKIQFHMHVSETREEVFSLLAEKKMRPLEYLESLGLVGSNSLFAHLGWVTKREIGIAGKSGLNVSNCPVSNLKLATGGICPVSEFMEAGANVTLGTDGAASNNSLNMIESMKFSKLLQTHRYWDAARVDTGSIWDAATRNGAAALGIEAGCIEEGKLADLAFADAKAASILPLHGDLRSIVYSLNPGNITDVMVDGEFVLREGEIKFADEESVLEKAKGVAHELVSR